MIFTKKKTTVDYVKSFFLVFFWLDLSGAIYAGGSGDAKTGLYGFHTLKITIKNAASYEERPLGERCDNKYWKNGLVFKLALTQADVLKYGDWMRDGQYTLTRVTKAFEDDESKGFFYDAIDFDLPKGVTLMDIPNVLFEYKFTDKYIFVEECWAQSVYTLPDKILTGQSLVEYPILYYRFKIPYIQSYGSKYPVSQRCEPGFWSTCNNDVNCVYNIPLQENPFLWNVKEGTTANYPVDRRPGPNVPIGHCFPCDSGKSMGHWNYSGNAPCGNLPNPNHPKCLSQIFDFGTFNRVYCPGGDYPPMLCPVNSDASTDRDRCVCKQGTYLDVVSQQCIFCEAGHYCKDNIKYTCETDTYQPGTGQTACLKCITDDGKSTVECGLNKLPGRCSLENDPNGLSFLTERRCVECSQCKNSIIQDELKNNGKNVFYDCYNSN